MSTTTEQTVETQELRDKVAGVLGDALREQEACRAAYGAPYSSHDAAVAYHKATGVSSGLARALEIIDGTR
jgi:hypothetical protein